MKGGRPNKESHVRPRVSLPTGRRAPLLSVQAAGFSRVIALFNVFSPHFSVARAWFLAGCERITVLIIFNFENAEANLLRKLKLREVLKGGRWNLNLANARRL